MDITILVLRLLAVYYLSVGLALLIGQLKYSKLLKSFEDSQGLSLTVGFILIILGGLLVWVHNIWEGWVTVITLVGWATLLKGVVFILIPSWYISFSRKLILSQQKNWLGVSVTVIGLLCGYFGFIA